MNALWLLVCVAALPAVSPVQSGWRPISGPSLGLLPSPSPSPLAQLSGHGPRTLGFSLPQYPHPHPHRTRPHPMCILYKAAMDQDTFQQYVQYKTQIQTLKEFTLCLWHKFYNHTQDQPLFSYAHRDKARGIYSWVANTDSASYYMLALNGQTLYRLNYPVRLHKWYHVCQSWNGKTGEWQIWVNAERIGRGFHNLLVGKPIKGGGMAISGQEQQARKATGLVGEVTLVQLYKAALTAGKAYTNHKHHHVHHFHHEDKAGEDDYDVAGPSTPAPTPPPQGSQFPFLSNGQIVPMLPVSELSAMRPPQSDPTLSVYSPFGSELEIILPGSQRLFKRDESKLTSNIVKRRKKSEDVEMSDTEVQDTLQVDPMESKIVKRDTTKVDMVKSKDISEEDILKEMDDEKDKEMKKRQTFDDEDVSGEKNHKKRTLYNDQFQFGLIPGDDLSGLFPGDGYILGGGGVKFDGNDNSAEPTPVAAQTEPAEWEVRSIMEVCSGCSEDPFRKANIISWRETPKKLFAGAMYVPAIPECQRF